MILIGEPPFFICFNVFLSLNIKGTLAAKNSIILGSVPLGAIIPLKLTLELSTSTPSSLNVGTSGKKVSSLWRSAIAKITDIANQDIITTDTDNDEENLEDFIPDKNIS